MFQDYVTYQATAAENIGLGELERIEDREAVEDAAREGRRRQPARAPARTAGTRRSASGSTAASSCPAASGRRSPSAGRSCATPGSSSSTSRRPRSTPRPSSSCSPGSGALAAGRTAIYISHRFSTVRQADRILFLEHGRLVEEGTHDELMALGGRYARLFTLQAAAYTGAPVDGLSRRSRPTTRRGRATVGRRWREPFADAVRLTVAVAVASVVVAAAGRGGADARRPDRSGGRSGSALSARTERRLNRGRPTRARTSSPPRRRRPPRAPDDRRPPRRLAAVGPRPAAPRATAATSTSRGWSRATSRSRSSRSTTKVPRHLNIERNDDRTDDVTLVALVQGWPRRDVAEPPGPGRAPGRPAGGDGGRVRAAGSTLVRSAADLDGVARPPRRRPIGRRRPARDRGRPRARRRRRERRSARSPPATGWSGWPTSSTTRSRGSAHGVAKGGLTGAGRELVGELEAAADDRRRRPRLGGDDRRRPGDRDAAGRRLAHRRPGVADNARNLTDDQLRGIAATGGMVGIGFWPTACGGDDAASIARSIAHAVAVVGADHVGLGSDFDGAVPTPVRRVRDGAPDRGPARRGPRRGDDRARSWAGPRSGSSARRCRRPERALC